MIVSIRANGLVCKIENREGDVLDFRHIDSDQWKTAIHAHDSIFASRDTNNFKLMCHPTPAMYQLIGNVRMKPEFHYALWQQVNPRGYFNQIDAKLLETENPEGFFPTAKIDPANPDFDGSVWPELKLPAEGGMPKGKLNTIGGLTSRNKSMIGWSGFSSRSTITKLPKDETKELHVPSSHLELSVHRNPWLFPNRQGNPFHAKLLSDLHLAKEEQEAFIKQMTEEALGKPADIHPVTSLDEITGEMIEEKTIEYFGPQGLDELRKLFDDQYAPKPGWVRPKHTDYPDLSKDLRELRYNMMLTRNGLGLSQREDRAAIAKLAREIHTIIRGPKADDQEFWNIFDWLLEDPRHRIDSLEKIEYNRDLCVKLIAIKKKEA